MLPPKGRGIIIIRQFIQHKFAEAKKCTSSSQFWKGMFFSFSFHMSSEMTSERKSTGKVTVSSCWQKFIHCQPFVTVATLKCGLKVTQGHTDIYLGRACLKGYPEKIDIFDFTALSIEHSCQWLLAKLGKKMLLLLKISFGFCLKEEPLGGGAAGARFSKGQMPLLSLNQ